MKIFSRKIDFFHRGVGVFCRRYYFSKKFFPGNFDNFSKVHYPTIYNKNLLCMAQKVKVDESKLIELIYEQVSQKLRAKAKKTYLIELSASDGYGWSSTKHYYVTECAKPPVDRRGELTQEAIADLTAKYQQQKYFSNSGYFTWRIVAEGEQATSLYKKYQLVKKALAELKNAGMSIN